MSFKRALEIIRDNEIERPKQLARLLWPDSEGWHRVHNVGHGASSGAAMPMAAGGLIGRLRKAGLIYGWEVPLRLTDKGREYLDVVSNSARCTSSHR